MIATRHPSLSRIAPLALIALLPLCAYSLPAHACDGVSGPALAPCPGDTNSSAPSDGQSVPQGSGAAAPQLTAGRSVPASGETVDPGRGQPPTYSSLSTGVGGEAASNTLSGTSVAGALNLFNFRHAGIGRSTGDARKECGLTPGRDCTNDDYLPPSYPTDAVEIDLAGLMGDTLSRKQTMGGAVLRARAFLGGTGLGRLERACSYYLGAAGQFDGSIYGNRDGESQIIAGIGPEGGLMCQTGNVMLQLGPTAMLNNTLVGTSGTLSKEIDTGKNMLALGGRARLIVGNSFYLSAQALQSPGLSGTDWESQVADVSAQLQVGRWVFMGSLKHIKMHDDSGISVDVKGNEGMFTAGRPW